MRIYVDTGRIAHNKTLDPKRADLPPIHVYQGDNRQYARGVDICEGVRLRYDRFQSPSVWLEIDDSIEPVVIP